MNTVETKYKKILHILDRWLTLKECGMSVGNYLKGKNNTKVAIYGLGVIGKHLLYELQQDGINVVYGIDKNSAKLDLNVFFMEWKNKSIFPEVDLLIVTAVNDYPVIEKELLEVRKYPIISFEDIINEMEYQRRNRSE